MRKKLTNNLGLKFISVLIAFVFWMIVVNIDDPITTKKFSNIPVQILNEAYIEQTGQMYTLNKEVETTVVLTGRRKRLQRIVASDIQATADLRQAVSLDTSPVMLPIVVTSRFSDLVEINTSPRNIAINLEEKVSQDFLVNVNSSDSKPEKGYEVGETVVKPEKISISGPSSLMKKIDKVVAYVNVGGLTQDKDEEVQLTVIDKNQEAFNENEMRFLKYDRSSVNVSVKLWKVQPEVKLVLHPSGNPADGYQLGEVVLTPNEISVAGKKEDLELLAQNGNQIIIPEGTVSVEGKTSDFEEKIDLMEFLPEHIRLTADTQSTVIADVSILPVGSRTFDIITKDIEIKNKPNNLDAVFMKEKEQVIISAADEKKLDTLKEADIHVSVDLSGLKEGEHSVSLVFELPEGYNLVSNVSADMTLSAIQKTE